MLTVYGRKCSFNVQKVMWFISELGIEHQHIEVGGRFGGLDSAEFALKNPNQRVPVIVDGTVTVWESQAILRYLAARYGSSQYWHSDPAKRSSIDQWMDWSQTALQPNFLTGVFWGFYRTPEPKRDMAAVNRAIEKTANCLQLLDQLIGDKDYLLENDLTLADIPTGTNLYRYYNLDIDRPSLPNVERWYAALQSRDAYRDHVMVPFDDLFGRLDY